jgi:hypothetical protein
VVYHATNVENIDSIFEHGLLRGGGRQGSTGDVFLCPVPHYEATGGMGQDVGPNDGYIGVDAPGLAAAGILWITGPGALIVHQDVAPRFIRFAQDHEGVVVRRQGERLTTRICTEPAPSGCLPSVDPMLASLAAACEGRALGVILSGMGRDGALGASMSISWDVAIANHAAVQCELRTAAAPRRTPGRTWQCSNAPAAQRALAALQFAP